MLGHSRNISIFNLVEGVGDGGWLMPPPTRHLGDSHNFLAPLILLKIDVSVLDSFIVCSYSCFMLKYAGLFSLEMIENKNK